MSNAHELKALQGRKAKLDAELKQLLAEQAALNKRVGETKQEVNSLQTKINNCASSAPMVTEHALLRYIERVMGVDLKTVENEILTQNNVAVINFSKNCTIKSANGVELIVKDKKVVSVV